MSTTVVVNDTVSKRPPLKAPVPGRGPRAGDGTWLEPDDTYYYVLNRKNMRYHCDHERHMLSRNLYSKRELDLFFEEIYMHDIKKAHKIQGICMVATGFFLIAIGLALLIMGWRQGWKDALPRSDMTTRQILYYIGMVLCLLIGAILLCLGFWYLCKRKANKTLRRKRLTEIINNENYRIAPRGLNWAFYDEHLALRTNYWTPRLRRKGRREVSVASKKTRIVEERVVRTPKKKVIVEEVVPRRRAVRTVVEERPVSSTIVKEEVVVSPRSVRSGVSSRGRYRNSTIV